MNFSFLGPRRMSERDLPSRLMADSQSNGSNGPNMMNGDVRGIRPNLPHAPIQSSKSVPALNSGGPNMNEMSSHGNTTPLGSLTNPGTPISGNGGGMPQQPVTSKHEVFNPGYSRTSSTNSIPQKTYEHQQALRSK